MKKLLATILAMIMALSLCACGGDDTPVAKDDNSSDKTTISENNNGGENEGGETEEPTLPSAPAEPTGEEWDVLNDYCGIVYSMDFRREDGKIIKYIYTDDGGEIKLTGSDAVESYYNELQEIDFSIVDKFKDTEYMYNIDNYDKYINMDYNAVLTGFTKVEDVLTKKAITDIDNLSNERVSTSVFGNYDADGSLIDGGHTEEVYTLRLLDPLAPGQRYELEEYTPEYVYDDAGRVSQIKYIQDGYVQYLVTSTYDDAGNKILDTIKSNTEEEQIIYTYDNNNRVTNVFWKNFWDYGNNAESLDYTYDANGNVASITRTAYQAGATLDNLQEWEKVEYTWDADGKVISATHTCTSHYLRYEQKNQYAFAYDDQGRVLTMTINYGDTYSTYHGTVHESPEYPIHEVEYIYGTYYIYTPAEVEAD